MRFHSGAIDLGNLETVCWNGDSFNTALLAELIGHFVEQNRRLLDQASDAVQASDREALRDLAHAVKGSAALLGAGRFHALAFTLEHDAESAELNELRAGVAALAAEFDAVWEAVRVQHPEACRGRRRRARHRQARGRG